MRIISGLKLCIGAAVVGMASAAAPTPVSNVQVTLKGKKYQIDDVTTLSELQERLEEQSGIPPSKQGKILHNGKRCGADSSLSEAGVAEGDQLNCVPSKKSSSSSKKKSTTTAAAAAPASDASTDSLADMMKGMGGAGGLDDVISKMMAGGMGGGAGGGMPDMAESMKMMKELTNSPMFSEYMNDPEKLEESRQMILSNPMMKSMMASMPGMSDLLEDKEAWAAAMTAAAGIMQSMDPEDMMKMMEAQGGAGGMGGMGMPPGMGGPGLFDGASSSALDELSEGED
mmetsp:Transcript_10496/g.22111  ORF Transcript_10496/g.22111 Transcript_10496/m.22111 type:complete len:285 (+) Transcript_10496:169-1023(+)|eukprot:CAMPEP_0201119924 /NCGR_PEP_ID=MMETSP0850-20130426/4010_1 /ASSEMBLY_ACC=CAM_ASM_000622 /TAXON_ID=183588 /ORGANISM="Pseudo-nitzschia fraudulenta, Strain WWA7" /LENGTH=284 /DNA_ID=CAMNT_0047385829 /DNA_START=190 /DNA_END=1044 /DNA_ORIENTATION=+